MAKKLYEENNIQAIADAIRSKNGLTDKYKPSEMAAAVLAIPAGGGGDLPEEAFLITDNCTYRFANGNWDWFIEMYGDRITTNDISNANYMFYGYQAKKDIQFVINMKQNIAKFNYFLGNAYDINVAPTIKLNLISPTYDDIDFTYLLYGCYNIRDAENMFHTDALECLSNIKVTSAYSSPKYSNIFPNCYSLRKIPSWYYKLRFSEESTAAPAYSYGLHYNGFNSCYVLDEVNNLQVAIASAAQMANMYYATFNSCYRLKNFTHETNGDGTPKVAQWKAQIIDLTTNVGYASNSSGRNYILKYNSGITADKEVKDDATYQALKNDPDWFTLNIAYSRYNHDSAVNTINSLPDTSAYLASAGGTNTIKFKGDAGSATDGGAINTLTADEIAVATAKGWTVTFA